MKPPQGVGPGELARLAVTRSLRLRLSLLPLLAVATLLSCRVAVLRPSEEPHPTPLNATWLRLAAGPPAPALVGEAELEDLFRDVAAAASARRLSPALWRQLRRLESTVSTPRLVAETRAALRNWSRRRRYDPGVMRELSSLLPGGSTRYPTCAVVGNSGILLRSEHGDLIDRHQLVIRLNNARIHGYQKNVGTKTSLSFVNSNILHHCSQRPGCFCHPYGDHVPLLMYICQATHFLDYVTCNATGAAPILLTDARFDLLCARIVKYYSIRQFVAQTGRSADDWDRSHDAKLFHYSSGMQAVMLAVGICDEVSLFGFGKSEAAKHHYHTNQKKELDLHDYEAEYLLYRDLAERPRRVPFLADSGFRVPPVVMYR